MGKEPVSISPDGIGPRQKTTFSERARLGQTLDGCKLRTLNEVG